MGDRPEKMGGIYEKTVLALIAFSLAFAPCLIVTDASAKGSTNVKGYTKKSGTYVAPHKRTAPNKTKMDNYSTKGNTNPYTGKAGTKRPVQVKEVADGPLRNGRLLFALGCDWSG